MLTLVLALTILIAMISVRDYSEVSIRFHFAEIV
jgi:hypothetical protein